MPKWNVTDNQTGDTLTIEGDQPPSEADVADIFSSRIQQGFVEPPMLPLRGEALRLRKASEELATKLNLHPQESKPFYQPQPAAADPLTRSFVPLEELAREPKSFVEGLQRSIGRGVATVESPIGAATLPLMEAAPLRPVLTGVFGGLAAKQLGEATGTFAGGEKTSGAAGELVGDVTQAGAMLLPTALSVLPKRPTKIVSAAFQDETGVVHSGQNHPAILDRLGIEGFDTRESRNTSQFGFLADNGKFYDRAKSAQIAKRAGQQLEPFDVDKTGKEAMHSDQVRSPVEPDKPIGDVKQPVSEKIAGTAVQLDDGTVIRGKTPNRPHALIVSDFENESASGEQRAVKSTGFVTSTGRYVLDDEAAKISGTGLTRLGAEHLTKTGAISPKNVEIQKQFNAEDAAQLAQRTAQVSEKEVPATPATPAVSEVQAPTPEEIKTPIKPEKAFDPKEVVDLGKRAMKAIKTLKSSPGEIQQLVWRLERAKAGEVSPLRDLVEGLEKKAAALKESRKTQGMRFSELFDKETEASGEDILSWIRDNMVLSHITQAKRVWSKEKFRDLKWMWDDMPENLAGEHHNLIYGQSKIQFGKRVFLGGEGVTTPAEVAEAAYRAKKLNAPDVNELWKAIDEASKKRMGQTKGDLAEAKMLAQDSAFAEASVKKPGATPKPVQTLNVGDSLEIGGEPFEVTKVDPNNGDVWIKDGTRFGVQILKEGDPPIWVEKYDPAPESGFDPEEGKPLESPAAAAPKPALQGMGGALYGEVKETPGERPAGIKVRELNRTRRAMGLPDTEVLRRMTDEEVWNSAMARWDREPNWPDELEAEIGTNPRNLNEEETVMMAIRKMDLENSLNRVLLQISDAYETGQTALIPGAQEQAAIFSDRLAKFLQDLRNTGTTQGRSFRLRRVMVNRDFSLAQMEQELRAARGGAPITDAERTELSETKKKLDEVTAQGQAAEVEWRTKVSELEAARVLAEEKAAAKAEPLPYDKRVLDAAQRFLETRRPRVDAARQRLAAKYKPGPGDAGGPMALSAGIDPSDLLDFATIASQRIMEASLDLARLTDEFIRDFGEAIRDEMPNIFSTAQQIVDEETNRLTQPVRRVVRRMDARDRIASAQDDITTKITGGRMDEVFPSIRRMVRGIVERSPDITRDALVDEVWTFLRGLIPELGRDDALDAVAGYGQFTELSKDAVSLRVRELKGQLQQVAKLRDISERGRRPLKSGLERREVGDEERRLIAQVNEAKRRNPNLVGSSNPARELQSALETRKRAVQNQISDLEYQINRRERILRTQTPPPVDAELTSLRAQRDALRVQFNEIFGRRELTDAQKAEREAKRLDREIEETQRQLKEGDIFAPGKKPKISTPEIEARRAQLAALQSERQYLRDAINPKKVWRTPEERWLSAYEARLNREIADKTERMAKGDFSAKPKTTPPPLPERLVRLKAQRNKIQEDWDRRIEAERLKNRTKPEKLMDAAVKLHQMWAISGIKSFFKLGSAMIEGIGFLVGREMVGAVLSKVPGIRDIAEKAPKEGGFDLDAINKAFANMYRKIGEDALKNIKGEKMDFEQLYGGFKKLPEDLRNWVGNTHAVLKGPLGRFTFEMFYNKLRNKAAREGMDVSSPEVDMMIGASAYLESQFWRLQNRNTVVTAFRSGLASLESAAKKHKAPFNIAPKALRFGLRMTLPVVTVPSNMVARLFEVVGGATPLPGGAPFKFAIRALREKSLRRAVENLTKEESDILIRQMKSGLIGLAFVTLGMLKPEYFGGYYQPREQRGPEEAKFGSVKFLGVNIPSLLVHNPFLEAAQFGATIRRVMSKRMRKKDEETQGLVRGLWGATKGALEQQPFVREAWDTAPTGGVGETDRWVGDQIRSYVLPMLVQNLAEFTDSADKRQPKNVWQHVEMGIPGLRQNVPEKAGRAVPSTL